MPSMYIKELALLVKLSPRRLYQINEELEPDKKLFVREDGTKADLATFVQRWVEYRESLVRGSAEMTLEEAKNVRIDVGYYKGNTLGELALRKPSDLEWYVKNYSGRNLALKAGAILLVDAASKMAS